MLMGPFTGCCSHINQFIFLNLFCIYLKILTLIENIHIDKNNEDDELMHKNNYFDQVDSDSHY
jgi:hypothetical protein